MNRDEIMRLEGVALAEAVARDVMGWKPATTAYGKNVYHPNDDSGRRIMIDGDPEDWDDFRPDTDHNHAAEVRARMCELYGGYWNICSSSEKTVQETHVAYYATKTGEVTTWGWDVFVPSETVAICRVALLAKAALG